MKNIKILQWNSKSLFYNIPNGIYKGLLAILMMVNFLAFGACNTPSDTDGGDTDNCSSHANLSQKDSDSNKDLGESKADGDNDSDNDSDNDACHANGDSDALSNGDSDAFSDEDDIDDDGDGLIEIQNEEMLDNIRHDLSGQSYKTQANGEGSKQGCGGQKGITKCTGYELVPDKEDTITLTKNWTPVADSFTAIFDGNGNTIANLTIVGSDNNENLGFFRSIGNNGLVRNLTIKEVKITGIGKEVGSLAGELSGQVERVHILNTDFSNTLSTGISVETYRKVGKHLSATGKVGGLVGLNNGSITNSYTELAVSNSSRVGGLVGGNYGSITSSYSTGTVSGNYQLGGLVGGNGGSIANSYATGTVSGDFYLAGLVGKNSEDGSITNSYSTGTVSGDSHLAGLVGGNYGSIANSYATGTVSGNEQLGGLVGVNYGSIANSYATGAVSGNYHAAGLVGGNYGSIENSYALGSVSGEECCIGGLVGVNYYETDADTIPPIFVIGKITNSYVHSSSSYTGAIVGNDLEDSGTVVSREDLKGLTVLSSKWSNKNWAFGYSTQFPTLRSSMANDRGRHPILCGQNVDFDKDGVIDWFVSLLSKMSNTCGH